MQTLTFRQAMPSDLNRCYEIETSSYAGEEAATKEKILKRIEIYPEGFLILENEKEIVGFVNSGAADQVELSDESFKELVGHHSDGKNIVIMSVVTHPHYQRQGMASRLMLEFIKQMRAMQKQKIMLICQTELIPMYASFGFVDLGPSDSEHGGLSWHEMELYL
jgi:ribosomal protein S18 acetylase RimI-like enzyme